MTDLPRRAVVRSARLAALPIGFAGRTAVGMGRRIGGAPAEAVLNEVQLRTAEQLFKTLGDLKGGAMKLGQALSVMESMLPEELAAPYREHLTKLQDSAPPMATATVHSVLSAEMGPRWRGRLVELDERPAAAASIGQVHHGRWKDGRQVAVKLQYPGAADALLSDLRQLSRVARTFGTIVPGVDMKPLVAEMQERVAEELDYGLEAEAQQAFADAFRDDPDYRVAEVVLHTERVLVSTWLDSTASLASLVDGGTQEERNHYGGLYVRFLFNGPQRVGLLHADPHPGNFRLIPDADGAPGRLGVVDFGAVARLPEQTFPSAVGRLLRRAVDDDYEGVLDGLREEGFIRPRIRIDPQELRDYLGPLIEPATTETFQFTREWARVQFQRLQDPRQPGSTLALRMNLPPSYFLIHRVWLGCVGVLCQLEADLPFRAILEESLPGFTEGLSPTNMR